MKWFNWFDQLPGLPGRLSHGDSQLHGVGQLQSVLSHRVGWLKDVLSRETDVRAARTSSTAPSATHIHEQIQDVSLSREDSSYWRPLSGETYQKDTASYLDTYNQCYEAYNSNPLASTIIELTTSFVLGEGVTISATNRRVQTVIDDFWQHPENHMDERVYSLCTELALYGEQFIHFFVNPYDGTVIIRQIDPALIDQVETDPEDVEKPLRYHRLACPSSGDDITPDTEGQWFTAGDQVLHFAINKVSNARRGRSDLATLLPWLMRYKDWLTDRVLINKYKGAFLWDVTLRGADKKTLEGKRMAYSRPPDPGSVIVHSEAEQWSAVEPRIQADDASADGRALKLMIAAGACLPEHYLADGDNGNRATATSMTLPTLLKFKRRQRVIKYMLRRILDRVIAEAVRAGKIGPRSDLHYDITFPEIDSGEHHTLAQSLNWLVPALQTARAQGWICDETAMKIMFEFCGEEIDVHAEQCRIAAQPGRPNNPA